MPRHSAIGGALDLQNSLRGNAPPLQDGGARDAKNFGERGCAAGRLDCLGKNRVAFELCHKRSCNFLLLHCQAPQWVRLT